MLDAGTSGAPPSRIQILPDALVDQIAAGEVVERPASVVKELVENSLDAGARSIQIDVRDGGAALIAVQDDGSGMTPEELPIALSRHATSKLRSAADLMRIASFGFRGEALPAIASVSRFRIVSRARGAAIGHELLIDGGRLVHRRAAGGPEGTRIEVAELFASVPARRKFLKRAGTEWGHIADWLARLAMVRPEIHFEIRRDDRKATVWPACRDRLDRLALLLPEEDAAGLVELERGSATEGLRISGFASSPEHSRANAQGIHLFVNGRPVRDRLLVHAVGEPYRDILPRGRFPVAVLFVEIAGEAVDVNVHPAKWEVRFSDPQSVHRAIRHAIRDAMGGRRWLALRPAPDGVLADAMPSAGPTRERVEDRARAPEQRAEQRSLLSVREAAADWPRTTDWSLAGATRATTQVASDAAETASIGLAPVASFGALRLLGQLRTSYLLAEGEGGLVVVDQHAAHERILYERLRRRWLDAGVARQGLLEPRVVPVTASAVAAVEAARDVVLRLGFEVEAFGEGALIVRAIPAELGGSDPDALVRDLAEALVEGAGAEHGVGTSVGDGVDPASEAEAVRWLPTLDRMFATLACHAARRFGDRLPEAEQRAILQGLDTIPWAPTCPHGRPVAVLIEASDLEARFRRR